MVWGMNTRSTSIFVFAAQIFDGFLHAISGNICIPKHSQNNNLQLF